MQSFDVPTQEEIWAEVPKYRVLKTRYADDAPLTKTGQFDGPFEDRADYIISTVQVKGHSFGQVESVEVRGWPPF